MKGVHEREPIAKFVVHSCRIRDPVLSPIPDSAGGFDVMVDERTGVSVHPPSGIFQAERGVSGTVDNERFVEPADVLECPQANKSRIRHRVGIAKLPLKRGNARQLTAQKRATTSYRG